MAQRKTAVEKRDAPQQPVVEVLTEAKGAAYPPGRMLISTPREIDQLVQQVPPGRVLRLSDLRQALAQRHGADYTCPLTTGILLRIAAEAAHEEQAVGKPNPLPYWRVVRDGGSLLDKLPGGPEAQAEKLRADGLQPVAVRTKLKLPPSAHLLWQPNV